MTIHPTALYPMIVSSSQSYTNYILSMEAERWASAAAGKPER